MTVQDEIVKRAQANHHDIDGGPARAEKNIRRKVFTLLKDTDDAMASTATAEYPVFRVPSHVANGIELKGIYYTSDATGVTAHDTNNATITFTKRDAAGANAAVAATATTSTTGTGNIAAFTPKEIPLSATLANRRLAAGEVLTLLISKASSGVIVPAGSFTIEYEEL